MRVPAYLTDRFGEVQVVDVRHDVDAATFDLQVAKHLGRRAEGGSIGVVRLTDGRVVLTCRSGLHAGWALVGGTVEHGQRFDSAFIRETLEETGLAVTLRRLLMLERKTFVAADGRELTMPLAVFDAVADTDRLPAQTAGARAEGLIVQAFDPAALPEPMILADRAKLDLALAS